LGFFGNTFKMIYNRLRISRKTPNYSFQTPATYSEVVYSLFFSLVRTNTLHRFAVKHRRATAYKYKSINYNTHSWRSFKLNTNRPFPTRSKLHAFSSRCHYYASTARAAREFKNNFRTRTAAAETRRRLTFTTS